MFFRLKEFVNEDKKDEKQQKKKKKLKQKED